MSDKKIAVCFFGITRSLSHTIASIKENILEHASRLGNSGTFAHFFDQAYIDNPRSGEKSGLNRDEYQLLNADRVLLEPPKNILSNPKFEEICRFGDLYDDKYQSLQNLFHQLWSLHCVTNLAMKWQPDVVIFARPDLRYHDSLSPLIAKALKSKSPMIQLPNWQHWKGVNDRFAVANGHSAIQAYGNRFTQVLDYCRHNHTPLHSEMFLKYALRNEKVTCFSQRASRVRVSGEVRDEQFQHHKITALYNSVAKTFNLEADNPWLAKLAWYSQRLVFGNPYK
ncbi:hypothetical protein DXV75_01655 [Alteromonas aestuariivivens]|uniref:Uncharacterized protein n=1 Tax=Alteromonas aestuariivivens TaxID=1938339 RepID=A0A3D8MEL0_9ALTE|nr:hypothetical protein [Alteromonas aestuariivivens]RDV29192.1 hypothetical protein DXV75_01655 [Alteromonas aestuariivivens]